MMFRPILLWSLLGTSHAAIDFITAFQNLQNADNPSLVWPTPNSNSANISSTFGPRRRVSCGGCYDFHRGIDIHGEIGDDVVAIYDGHVERKVTYTDGGLTLVIEHTPFDDNVTLVGETTTKRWYTLYMHLNSTAVEEGDVVAAGQIIGAVGMTGEWRYGWSRSLC
jgi:murein DD-endopeptidase MepM/ murein hydrolase activator NlpD